MAVTTRSDVASSLLAYVRARLDNPSLAYASPPERFTTGVENRVFGLRLADAPPPFDGPLVLRLYAAATDPAGARLEGALQNAVADQGFPAPRVVHICEDVTVLGGPFILMQRLPGRPMLEPLTTTGAGIIAPLRNWRGLLFRMPEVVADLMSSLHRLDTSAVRARLVRDGVDPSALAMGAHVRSISDRIEAAGLDGFRDGMRWIETHLPAESPRLSVCHGDLWFGNVLEENRRVTGLVDWSRISARIADPAYDVGTSSVMLAGGMADIPGPLRFIGRRVQRGMSDRFLRAYQRQAAVDMDAVRYYQLVRCIDFLSYVAWRRLDPTLRAREERDMLDIPGSSEGLEAIFKKSTGIPLPMPPRPR